MNNYEYLTDDFGRVKWVVVNGNEYDIHDELTYTGKVEIGLVRPYIRQNTKQEVYDDIKETHPDVYRTLRNYKWFIDKYYVEETVVVKQEMDEEMVNDLKDAITLLTKKVSEPTHLETQMIEAIIAKGKELSVDDLLADAKKSLDGFIKENYGELPQRMTIVRNEIEYTATGIFHEQFENILKLVNMELPVMLTGGAGSGKNYMLEQVSEAMELPFYYTSTITQEYKLTGFIDGGGKFHETEFYKAFTGGGIFMLDEIDASIPEALVILNGAIANGYFDFPIGRELAHEDFRVVCAGNTVGLGADMIYTGRNVLDGATLDRFVMVEINYDQRIEEMLCPDDELRNYLYDFRRVVDSNKINHIVGMRTLKYAYEMLMNGFDKAFINKSVVTKGLMIDDINNIKRELGNHGQWTRELK